MALQLSGSISLTGSFNTTQDGIYSGSAKLNQVRLAGSIYDGSNFRGEQDQVLTIDSSGKSKWIVSDNIGSTSDTQPTRRDFDYLITWEGDLNFSGSAVSIPILGDNYSIDETVLTLSAADPTYPRFDAIVATTGSTNVGTFEVVEGTPAQNPFYPTVDQNKSIALKYILVRAGSTVPGDGGTGEPDNGDGTNDPDDTDDGSYAYIENREIFDESTPSWAASPAYSVLPSDAMALFGATPSKVVVYKLYDGFYDNNEGTRFYPKGRAHAKVGWQMLSFHAGSKDVSSSTGMFNLENLNSLIFYIKPVNTLPDNTELKVHIELVVDDNPKNSLTNSYVTEKVLNNSLENSTYWTNSEYKKIEIAGRDFSKAAYFDETIFTTRIKQIVISIWPNINPDNEALTLAAGSNIKGASQYQLYFDAFYAQLGTGQSFEVPSKTNLITGTSISVKQAPFEATYGSPTVKNIKINTKGTKLIGEYSNILGGINNIITGSSTFVDYCYSNITSSVEEVDGPLYSSILGGSSNMISGSITGSVIVGGSNNRAYGNYNVVGGYSNIICSNSATIAGGDSNIASGNYSLIGAGRSNQASGGYAVVAGGRYNCALETFSFIGAGCLNSNCGVSSTITAGCGNCIETTANCSFIGGGSNNRISSADTNSSIVGGFSNSTTFPFSFVAGGQKNQANNQHVFIGGGSYNTGSSEYNIVVGGTQNKASGVRAIIVGGYGNCTTDTDAIVVGGVLNSVSGEKSSIINGVQNTVSGGCSTLGGGQLNTNTGNFSFIGGGCQNELINSCSSIVGGYSNSISGSGISNIIGNGAASAITGNGSYNFIGVGYNNKITTTGNDGDSAVVGGQSNCIENTTRGFIGSGFSNCITNADYSGILGGNDNTVSHANSFIVGSNLTSNKTCYTFMNNIDVEGTVSASIFSGSFVGDGSGLTGISGGGGGGGDYSPFTTGSINSTGILPTLGNNSLIVGANATVAGGTFNTGSGQCTFIGGGQFNYASTQHGAVVAGCKNKALSPESAVVGGHDNHACANQAFIGAGRYNTVCGYTGGIVSGDSNCISSAVNYSFIGGGTLNTASAHCSAILGGDRNYISGSLNNSFIVGSDITATAACTTYVNNFYATGSIGSNNVVILANLPTANPNNSGQLWVDTTAGCVLKVSQG